MTHILVVDDEPSVLQSVRALLRRSGFEVTTADGGDSGLKELDRTTFQLMIVDVFMPHMHGFESIRLFHQRAPKVPLIAMSGYAFAESDSLAPDFLSMAIHLGAWRCLRKPFTAPALLFVIRECLQEVAAMSAVHASGLKEPRDS
jgi:CheY-like chemotaxis protein